MMGRKKKEILFVIEFGHPVYEASDDNSDSQI